MIFKMASLVESCFCEGHVYTVFTRALCCMIWYHCSVGYCQQTFGRNIFSCNVPSIITDVAPAAGVVAPVRSVACVIKKKKKTCTKQKQPSSELGCLLTESQV